MQIPIEQPAIWKILTQVFVISIKDIQYQAKKKFTIKTNLKSVKKS